MLQPSMQLFLPKAFSLTMHVRADQTPSFLPPLPPLLSSPNCIPAIESLFSLGYCGLTRRPPTDPACRANFRVYALASIANMYAHSVAVRIKYTFVYFVDHTIRVESRLIIHFVAAFLTLNALDSWWIISQLHTCPSLRTQATAWLERPTDRPTDRSRYETSFEWRKWASSVRPRGLL